MARKLGRELSYGIGEGILMRRASIHMAACAALLQCRDSTRLLLLAMRRVRQRAPHRYSRIITVTSTDLCEGFGLTEIEGDSVFRLCGAISIIRLVAGAQHLHQLPPVGHGHRLCRDSTRTAYEITGSAAAWHVVQKLAVSRKCFFLHMPPNQQSASPLVVSILIRCACMQNFGESEVCRLAHLRGCKAASSAQPPLCHSLRTFSFLE